MIGLLFNKEKGWLLLIILMFIDFKFLVCVFCERFFLLLILMLVFNLRRSFVVLYLFFVKFIIKIFLFFNLV